jgi:hypothetical protein
MASLFGSTYLCEQFFLKMNVVKNISRNRLDDERLESCLRVATSEICPDINILVAKNSTSFLIDILLFNKVGNLSCKNIHLFHETQ